jgi:hypothetical protein
MSSNLYGQAKRVYPDPIRYYHPHIFNTTQGPIVGYLTCLTMMINFTIWGLPDYEYFHFQVTPHPNLLGVISMYQ